jgi:hypothetical protein
MSYNDYIFYAAEVSELQSMLERIPKERVIDRKSLEYRLKEIQEKLDAIKECEKIKPVRPRLTFNGGPVLSNRGGLADFLSGALRMFIKATYTVAASLIGRPLSDTGRLPGSGENPILLVGSAVGSFGFELEIIKPDDMNDPNEIRQRELFDTDDSSLIEESIKIIIELFKRSANDSNEAVAEIVEKVEPRAIRSIEKFLTFTTKHNAFCAVAIDKDVQFRYRDINSIIRSKEMLSPGNFKEETRSFAGHFIGILPKTRRFEFRVSDTDEVIKGKILKIPSNDIEDFNKNYLFNNISVDMKVYRIGDSKPRYSVETLQTESLLE